MTSHEVKQICSDAGFELCGVAACLPNKDFSRYQEWASKGAAGAMTYLTDRRAELRQDPRQLLPSARSVICVGKLYHGPEPLSTEFRDQERGWISCYAWGDDYHSVMTRGLQEVAHRLGQHEWKICVDTAPLLERSYARAAGLGWIGKNTCLINQGQGSWFFLGELLTSLVLDVDATAPARCGTCTRCIDACPTHAIAPAGYEIDARACISYFTIELKGLAPEEYREHVGTHVFGCDICQDVCPWNRRAPHTNEPAFAPEHFAPPLEELATITQDEFHRMFQESPIRRARYAGFLRNVAIAMGNSGKQKYRALLEELALNPDVHVREACAWALQRL